MHRISPHTTTEFRCTDSSIAIGLCDGKVGLEEAINSIGTVDSMTNSMIILTFKWPLWGRDSHGYIFVTSQGKDLGEPENEIVPQRGASLDVGKHVNMVKSLNINAFANQFQLS